MSAVDAGAAALEPDRQTVPPRVIDSAELLLGAVEIRIRHQGDEYRLRVTRQKKLILTK